MRTLFIDYCQFMPCYQHQNFVERRHKTAKKCTNTLLDRTGAPLCSWFLAMIYVCFVLNHTYNVTIKNIPMNAATGSTCDISPLHRFHFLQHVYFNLDDSNFPSGSIEETGWLAGIIENSGHDMNFMFLTYLIIKLLADLMSGQQANLHHITLELKL